MLFNSFIFILIFLPIVLIAFYLSGKYVSARCSIGILVVASFIFYAYWEPVYLFLLLASIVVNYIIGLNLNNQDIKFAQFSRLLLIVGVSLNLGVLGYFKYTDFLISNVNTFTGVSAQVQGIILPLAISFFTFQQVAYLVDCYRKEVIEKDFLNYCLFVSFFPQLIAGPIVHHKEMMPQFSSLDNHLKWDKNIRMGSTLFIIGLFKKIVIADNFSVYANKVFDNPGMGALSMGDAWLAALAYHFQIYFDFSGYSDMAIGLAYMFGIILPINFNSPYKSRSIIDFWRRWHMTLSRFLRDYLYISFGGNRKGRVRRYINLFMTMLIGGLWHGAAWNFVIWGGLHGVYLILNHFFNAIFLKLGLEKITEKRFYIGIGILFTNIAVIVAWVYFRAEDVSSANRIISAMFGFSDANFFSKPYLKYLAGNGFGSAFSLFITTPLSLLAVILLYISTIVFLLKAPNACQLLNFIECQGKFQWSPSYWWALSCAVMFCCSFIGMFGVSEFIYYQF